MALTELDAARRAATAAGEIIRTAYRTKVDVVYKADASPVTEVDIACEKAIKAILAEAGADYGYFGEETGQSDMDRSAIWLIDPLDGTKSFVRGYPFISTQIALMRDGELVLGVSSAPLFDEMAWAERGGGAYLNGDRLQVSDIDQWSRATLSTGNIGSLAASPQWANLGELITAVHRIRGYGDFYHYHLLASGRIDAVVESDLNILDIAALTVILREAGGQITDLHGAPIGLETGSVLAANPQLHADLLQRFAGYAGAPA